MRAKRMIAGIVLAAGGSTRMGRPKMLLPAGGGTLLSAAVAPLLEAGLELVVVVLGDRAEEIRRRAQLPAAPAAGARCLRRMASRHVVVAQARPRVLRRRRRGPRLARGSARSHGGARPDGHGGPRGGAWPPR